MKRSELKEMIRPIVKEILNERNLYYSAGSDAGKFNFKITIPVSGTFYKYQYSDKTTKKLTQAETLEARYHVGVMEKAIFNELKKQFSKIIKVGPGGKFELQTGDSARISFEKRLGNDAYEKS